MTMQRRKIISSQDLILLNEEAFASGRTYIERETIVQIAPFGVHVVDKYIAVNGWADCYILLAMDGNFNDPHEAHIEIRVEDFAQMAWGIEIEG